MKAHTPKFSRVPQDVPEPLHQAAKENDLDTLRIHLNTGLDVDAKDGHGRSPLHVAVKHSAVDAIRVLVEAGADTNSKDPKGLSPFQVKLKNCPSELCELTGSDKRESVLNIFHRSRESQDAASSSTQPTPTNTTSSSGVLFSTNLRKLHAITEAFQGLARSSSNEKDGLSVDLSTKGLLSDNLVPLTPQDEGESSARPPKLKTRRSTSQDNMRRRKSEDKSWKTVQMHVTNTAFPFPSKVEGPLLDALIRGVPLARQISSCLSTRRVAHIDDACLIRVKLAPTSSSNPTSPHGSPSSSPHASPRNSAAAQPSVRLPHNVLLKPLRSGENGLAELNTLENIFSDSNPSPSLRSYMPAYHGAVQLGDFVWLMYEDTLPSLGTNSVIHLRMSRCPFFPSASTKPIICDDDYKHYPDLGFRVASITVPTESAQEPIFLDRSYGMCLTPTDVHVGFLRFLTPANAQLNRVLAHAVRDELLQVVEHLTQHNTANNSCPLVSGSLIVACNPQPQTHGSCVWVGLLDLNTPPPHQSDFTLADSIQRVADIIKNKIL